MQNKAAKADHYPLPAGPILGHDWIKSTTTRSLVDSAALPGSRVIINLLSLYLWYYIIFHLFFNFVHLFMKKVRKDVLTLNFINEITIIFAEIKTKTLAKI